LLESGWRTLAAGNIAWLANPLLLAGVGLVFAGRRASGRGVAVWGRRLALAAVVVALEAFIPGELSLKAGGSVQHVVVRGYGWGTMLWVLSPCLLMVAAGMRRVGWGVCVAIIVLAAVTSLCASRVCGRGCDGASPAVVPFPRC